MIGQSSKLNFLYELLILVLALLSITLVICDFIGVLTLDQQPFAMIDNLITGIFALDYVIKLFNSKSKWKFIRTHVFDLLAIIPFNLLFAFFRLSRLARVVRLGKIARLAGVTARLRIYFQVVLRKNGLLYIFYVNLVLVTICSAVLSNVEQKSFLDSLWWSIATITTVGYGDIVPITLVGKLVAIVLMLSGIGTLGLLTSALTNFLVASETETEKQLDRIEKEILEQRKLLVSLQESLERLEKSREE